MTVDELINELAKAKEHGVLGTDPVGVSLGTSREILDLKINSVLAVNTHEAGGNGGSVSIYVTQ